jgi:5-methylcytosine-specific restriction endonuclease McrA
MRCGQHCSKETKEKLAIAHRGTHLTEETRAKLFQKNKGHVVSSETRAKISAAEMGHSVSQETRTNISRAGIGHQNFLGHHLSSEAKEILSALRRRLIGPLSSHCKGGITPRDAAIRESSEYKAWRTAVFDRDHYTCQECGDITSGNLEGHHIHEFAKYPDERFLVENGKTLCIAYHNKTRLGRPRQLT